MPGSKMNQDLVAEREKRTFDAEEFAVWWNGGSQKLKEKRDRGKNSIIISKYLHFSSVFLDIYY